MTAEVERERLSDLLQSGMNTLQNICVAFVVLIFYLVVVWGGGEGVCGEVGFGDFCDLTRMFLDDFSREKDVGLGWLKRFKSRQ